MNIEEISMLLPTLTQHVALMLAAAFVLFTLRPMRRIGLMVHSPSNQILLALIFGTFGIMGTYGGDQVLHSYANLRAMSVITAGLLGGPFVGAGAGFIAGGHRFLIDIGGFSAAPCAMATILEGIAAGILHRKLGARALGWKPAAILAVVGETLHMVLILAMARPLDEALVLVQIIALPMILLNALGAGLFVSIIGAHNRFHEVRDSNYAHKILSIANRTLAHLRSGLNCETAERTATIILSEIDVAGVALTSKTHVLAHVGAGADHHKPGQRLITKATRKAIEQGRPAFIHSRNGIGCADPKCPFNASIIAPLLKGGEVIGALKFYGVETHPLNDVMFELAKGLAELFSTQLELEEIETRSRLLATAEIRRLQAQINPHFLFNSLGAIASFCRTQPDKARHLLQDLAQYMRKNLDNSREAIAFADELEQVDAYLAIEKARFEERITVKREVPPAAASWQIPPLMVQPLVENAVRHGICAKEGGGTVRISAKVEGEELVIQVADDGVGMPEERITEVLEDFSDNSATVSRTGWSSDRIGLRNCHERLVRLFGAEHGLRIDSQPGAGTRVTLRIPRQMEQSEAAAAEAASSLPVTSGARGIAAG